MWLWRNYETSLPVIFLIIKMEIETTSSTVWVSIKWDWGNVDCLRTVLCAWDTFKAVYLLVIIRILTECNLIDVKTPICYNLRAVLQLKEKTYSIAKNNLNLLHAFLSSRRLVYNPPHVIISSFPFLPVIFKAHGYL